MKNIAQSFIVLLMLLANSLPANAHDFEETNKDGVTIYYKILSDTTCAVTFKGYNFNSYNNEYKGTVFIPNIATYKGKALEVVAVDKNTFYNCDITYITLPYTIEVIAENAFSECKELSCVSLDKTVYTPRLNVIKSNAFKGCNLLNSFGYKINIANTNIQLAGVYLDCISTVETGVFSGCAAIQRVSFNEETKQIGPDAFKDCVGLTSISLPDSLEVIGKQAFDGCNNLIEVKFPNKLKIIGERAFSETNIKTINIPEGVTEIGSYAFSISNATFPEITIPSTVRTMGIRVFNGCTIEELFFNANRCVTLSDYTSSSSTNNVGAFGGATIQSIVFSDNIKDINVNLFIGINVPSVDITYTCIKNTQTKTFVKRNILYKGTPMSLSDNATYVTACSRKTAYYENKYTVIPLVEDYESVNFYKEISDTIQFEDLYIAHPYTIETKILLNKWLLRISRENDVLDITTKDIDINITCVVTQTTITLKAEYDAGDAPVDGAFWYDPYLPSPPNEADPWDGTKYYCDELTYTDLKPGTYYPIKKDYYVESGVCSSGKHIEGYTTTSLSPQITTYNITPTTINARGEYVHGDAVVTETILSERKTEAETNAAILRLKDLLPEETYRFEYRVQGDGFSEYASEYVTTPAPTLEVLPAKPMSKTVALLAATTNLADEVENVGFEWRRYDAPETMPSSRVEAIVIDGVLTGALSGVNPDIYYNYRPYFSCKNGKEYFGDWITFLTGDALVHFDPTVRTYAAEIIDDFSARLSGSAVRGSSDILRQGFQYWPNNATRGIGELTEVEVSGQRMSFVITGLQAGTSYSYRTFVQTEQGTTYGQTEEFTTSNVTPVTNVHTDGTDVKIRGSLKSDVAIAIKNNGSSRWGLYTMNGTLVATGYIEPDGEFHRIDIPDLSRGLYILSVKYNDGEQSFKLQK